MDSTEISNVLSEMAKLKAACAKIKELDLSAPVFLTGKTNGGGALGTGSTHEIPLSKSLIKDVARTAFNTSARNFNQLAASINCTERIELQNGKEISTTDDGAEG